MLTFLGIVVVASLVWLMIGGILSGHYEYKIGYLEYRLKEVSIPYDVQIEQAQRMLIYARKVIDNRWFFNNAQATTWFSNYCDRYDPQRKQRDTAELQAYLVTKRPELRKYMKKE